jgi:ATP-dependent Clp protease ATP-binding subunit ClpC
VDAATAVATVIVGILALIGLLVVVGLVWEGVAWVARRRRGAATDETWDFDLGLDTDDVRSHAAQLELEHDWWNMTLEGLEALPEFRSAVAILVDDDTDVDEVVALSRDADGWVAAMALAALAERDDVPAEWVAWALRDPVRPSVCEDRLLFRALSRHTDRPVVGLGLAQIGTLRDDVVAEFVRDRLARGEAVGPGTFDAITLDATDGVEAFLYRHEPDFGPALREGFEHWRAMRTLRDVGRVWERPYDEPPALLVGRRRELVEIVGAALEQSPPRSVLLVGEHGVGKTALARAALDRLDEATVVFETTAAQINAGAIYIGELEGRVKTLVDAVAGQQVVWVVPELQETLFAGQHSRSPQGLLDALLPHIESGAIALVAEVTPQAAELLVAARPRVKSAFEVVRVRPLDDPAAVAVARHALDHDALEVTADDETLGAALELAQQFLPGVAQPGNVLRLVHATAAEAAESGASAFDGRDVLATLAASSGLPLALLDATAPLPLDDVRAFFTKRVLEQPEAVECIVERIAMVKAGVTDPTRPLGVFLFVGPTGTGKTEIAKALAEFLFGSQERLIRLDMSEFQTQDSFDRLLADTALDAHGATLVSSVRKDPFAVVLLDEFEKAAQPVRDLFLQVFDDGRLTDLQGRVVDFRRSVIVLTSNIGSPLAHGPRVGFDPSTRTFSAAGIDRAVRQSFRPELVNRFDRVVVFRPFERSAMRALLDKELADALARRGLRGRPWAVEVDEAAYSFLIEKGFSRELGARPLKRAVEQYLLAPLAAAIVEQSVPDGDQFLFVTAPSGERIEVTFVDPDAEPEVGDVDEDAALDVTSLARAPNGDDASVRFVLGELARVVDAVEEAQLRKGHALSAVGEPGFWERDDRFEVLAEAEYLDRMQAASKTARRLGERLRRSIRSDGRANAELVGLLAGRIYVLDRALAGLHSSAPTEVFVHVRPSGLATGESGSDDGAFAAILADMYVGWADRCGMHVERLDGAAGDHLLAVSGLGCGEILRHEAGLHVLEVVDDQRDGSPVVDRDQVQVVVARRPPGEARGDAAVVREARRVTQEAETTNVVVRRYRPGKSPLVRDSVRGYRTGRLERVLAGDFDLF